MKIDNFYFVVENIEDSIMFYSKILQAIDGLIGKMKTIKFTLG